MGNKALSGQSRSVWPVYSYSRSLYDYSKIYILKRGYDLWHLMTVKIYGFLLVSSGQLLTWPFFNSLWRLRREPHSLQTLGEDSRTSKEFIRIILEFFVQSNMSYWVQTVQSGSRSYWWTWAVNMGEHWWLLWTLVSKMFSREKNKIFIFSHILYIIYVISYIKSHIWWLYVWLYT